MERSFDVICAGEAVWTVAPRATELRFRPGDGAVNAAVALARQGLRVGLATVLVDDTHGRTLRERLATLGVDTEGVALSTPSTNLVFVGGGEVVPFRDEERPVAIPSGWSSQVLLLSGMSPIVAHGAALCRAARAARRAGTVVVVDLNTRWHLWKGRDPRAIRMVLREADVVWCSAEDLFGLNMDLESLRAALRPNAVLAVSDGAGTTWAEGPFGEIARRSPQGVLARPGDDDAFAVAICAELARAGHGAADRPEMWSRALARGEAAIAS